MSGNCGPIYFLSYCFPASPVIGPKGVDGPTATVFDF